MRVKGDNIFAAEDAEHTGGLGIKTLAVAACGDPVSVREMGYRIRRCYTFLSQLPIIQKLGIVAQSSDFLLSLHIDQDAAGGTFREPGICRVVIQQPGCICTADFVNSGKAGLV